MEIVTKIKQVFSRKELKTYAHLNEALDEIKNCPHFEELIFEKREESLRKVFKLTGEEKLREEGKILAYNDILGIDQELKRGIRIARQVAHESGTDIDEELDQLQNDINEL